MYGIIALMSRHKNLPSTSIFAQACLLSDGFHEAVRVDVVDGRISNILKSAKALEADVRIDMLLPALSNLHSHTFQRGMVGMTEMRGPNPDSFWTWREVMYRFVSQLSPDDVEAIAAQAFMEMQEAGFAAVAEFHYLHNDQSGLTYANAAEMSNRILAAASETGIGLTHLPVLYCFGGAGEKPLTGGQLRFGKTFDEFLSLTESAQETLRHNNSADCNSGVAPHSLRAVSPHIIMEAAKAFPDAPFHIHIAEQQQEVDEILDWLKARPVEWLLNSLPVNDCWCLIHATHLSDVEIDLLAASAAVVGLCPITEANLGDGIFRAPEFMKARGLFGIGTDSNVAICASGELRLLEYGQRLKYKARNVLAMTEGSTGLQLYKNALIGGARALGRQSGEIAVGAWADLVGLDTTNDQLCALSPEQVIDGFIFTENKNIITDLWSAGRHCVKQGQHIQRSAISKRYRNVMSKLSVKL